MERLKLLLRNLLSALSNPSKILIHDSEFYPFEFFVDPFVDKFKIYLTTTLQKPADTHHESTFLGLGRSADVADGDEPFACVDVKRPSVYLEEVKGYLTVVQWIDTLVPINCSKVVRDVLLEQIDAESARAYTDAQPDKMVYQLAPRDPKSKSARNDKNRPPAVVSSNVSILVMYMAWYCEFAGSRATTGTICFSPSHKAIVSKSHLQFQAETYTNVNELCALATLLGPPGIQFLDSKLTAMASSLATATRDFMVANSEVLERLRSGWMDEGRCVDVLKRFKSVKEMTNKSMTLGFVLELRKLVLEAVTMVFGEKCAHMLACIRTAHEMVPPDSFGLPEYKTIDAVATQIGLSDSSFKSGLTNTADTLAWYNLPYLYAASLWHMAFDDTAVYNLYINGLENNGHCLTTAYESLCSHMVTAVMTAGGSKEEVETVGALHRDFVLIASTLLMRLKQRTTDKELQTRNLDSVILVLKRFIDTSPHLSSDTSESFLPYALLQSISGDLYRKRAAEAAGVVKKAAGGVGVAGQGAEEENVL
ncbi:Nck-associated protein 1, partial [Borealophlyctis nickersoniae]